MPLDERWDRLTEDDWLAFAQKWVMQLQSGIQNGDRDYGLSVTMMNFTARPLHQWNFLLAAISYAETDEELGHIAAGPIEHILGWHGNDYIDNVERQAAINVKFARALKTVQKYLMSDDIWARVQALQSRS